MSKQGYHEKINVKKKVTLTTTDSERFDPFRRLIRALSKHMHTRTGILCLIYLLFPKFKKALLVRQIPYSSKASWVLDEGA